MGPLQPPRKSVTAMPAIAKALIYSAIKKMAYLNPEYSVR
jgi:hypothetical protein